MDISDISSDDTPTSPGNQSDTSEDNLSSQTLEKVFDDVTDATDFAKAGQLDYVDDDADDISVATLAQSIDAPSDRLSTGVLNDNLPYFNFFSLNNDTEEDGFVENKVPTAKSFDQKKGPNEKPKSNVYPTVKQSGNPKLTVRNSTKPDDLASKIAACRLSEPLPRKKKFSLRPPVPKESEQTKSSRQCQIPGPSNRNKTNYCATGLLKASTSKPSTLKKLKRPAVTDDMVLSIQGKLSHEIARNKDLNNELDRCQQHMREAAAAYADLGKLALMERERAEKAEMRLKEALFRIKELEMALEAERKRAFVGSCNDAISSFVVDNEMPSSFKGESLEKIEFSLKNVLNEIAKFRQRNSSDDHMMLFQQNEGENVSPVNNQKGAPRVSFASSQPAPGIKSRQQEFCYNASRSNSGIAAQSAGVERSQELRRAVQHLLTKRVGGPFRP